jgi:hypothetical protein
VSHSRSKLARNPFYTLLMVASLLFVVTTLGYLVGPFVEQRAIEGVGERSALVSWLDRKGVLALAIEFGAMCVLALLAVATDRHFTARKGATDPSRGLQDRPGPA